MRLTETGRTFAGYSNLSGEAIVGHGQANFKGGKRGKWAGIGGKFSDSAEAVENEANAPGWPHFVAILRIAAGGDGDGVFTGLEVVDGDLRGIVDGQTYRRRVTFL